MGVIRESFIIFKDWDNAIRKAPEDIQLELYHALMDFASTGVMPENLSWQAEMLMCAIQKSMGSIISKYNASVENGKLGGRPKKAETQQNLEKPKETQQNPSEPNPNLNVNVNVNDNVNDIKLVNKELNIFENYNIARVCERVPVRTNVERKPFLDYYKEFFDYCFADKFKNAALEIIDTIIEAKEQAQSEKGLLFNQKKYDSKIFIDLITKIDCNKFRKIVIQIVYNENIQSRTHYILGCVINAANTKGCEMTHEQMERFISEMEL